MTHTDSMFMKMYINGDEEREDHYFFNFLGNCIYSLILHNLSAIHKSKFNILTMYLQKKSFSLPAIYIKTFQLNKKNTFIYKTLF